MSAATSASLSHSPSISGTLTSGCNDRFGKGIGVSTLGNAKSAGVLHALADSGRMGSRCSISSPLAYVWVFAILCLLGFVSPIEAQSTVQFPGLTAVGANAAPQTATITIANAGTISAIKVRTQGNDGFDYSNAGGGTCSTNASYSAGQQCTVVVGFKPVAPGERRGAVVLLGSNGVVLGTQLLDGFGSGSLGVFVPGQINTVAGESIWIYNGEGNATGSAFFLPFGVTVDAAGNLYITDTSNTRVRKVDAVTQQTSTIAGNGTIGGTGDGGPATSATLSSPSSVVLDPAGNVFFADSGNNVVRKINVFDGTISTVVGTMGQHGYTGDGGLATAATLNGPNGLAFDAAGNLYLADTSNNVIRKVNAATGVITTIAGRGVAGYGGNGGSAVSAFLNAPWGITVSSTGEVYIADQNNNQIRKVSTAGVITAVVGTSTQGSSGDDGPATAALLNEPAGIVFDVAGNLIVSDSGNNVIRKVNAATGIITTIAGNGNQAMSGDGGPADIAGIYGPYTLALDGQGSIIFADVFHNRVRKISANAATQIYPPIRVGRVTAPQQQKMENDGNAAMHVSSVQPTSMSQIDQASTTCSTSAALPVLGTCLLGLDFAPTQTGKLVMGSASVLSDASNSPGVVTLEGEVDDTDPTTLALTSSLNPSTTGQKVTFTITATSAGATPTGTITLLDGTTTIATGTLNTGGVVSFDISNFIAGSHPITASYGGDASNGSAVSAVLTQVVRDLVSTTSTSLISNINPLNAGAIVQFTATVTVVTTGAGTGSIAGTMVFTDGLTQLGSSNVVNGVATLNVSTLAIGTHNVVASYGGNSSYAASKSSALAEVVVIASSKTALSTSANPSIAGSPITLTATVLTTGGIATGPVSFLDGTTVLGTGVLNKQGVATLTVPGTAWTVGTHTLTASYGGDVNDTGSVSSVVSEVVNIATTTIAVTSPINPIGLGGSVTFTGTVTGNGGLPTGTVQFYDASTLIGSGTLNGNGAATFTTTTLALGSHPITAVYGGDTYDGPSTSASMTEVVQAATDAISFSTSGNPVVYQSPLVMTVAVTGSGSKPAGTVSFTDAGISIGSATLDANGNATFTISTLERGVHPLLAVYGGDANHGSVTSAMINQDIRQATSTTISVNNQATIAGQPVQWTANVQGLAGKSLTGSASFYDGTTLIATIPLDASGAATYSSTSMAPGQHSFSVKYSGDSLDFDSASTPVTNVVTIATTTTTLATSANPVNSGTALALTSTVSGNGGVPTGSITFLDGTAVLSVVPVSVSGGGAGATLTISTLTPGIHKLSASYGGDTLDHASVSTTINEQVAQKTSVTVASSANPSLLTDNVTITVTVSNGAPTAIPTGMVTLTDGGVMVGTAGLDANGNAAFTLSTPALGAHTLSASYAGDAQNLSATAQPFIQTVTLRPSTNTFSSSTTNTTAGKPIVLVSVVQGVGPKPPTGTVTFASGATVLGTAAISASGVATLTVTPPQGTYNVVSTYNGDSLYASSNSAAISIVIAPTVAFTISMTPAELTIKSGEHATLQVAIATGTGFTDTLAIGCAGLPQAATCTFSQNEIKVSGGLSTNVTVTVDTGNPLGAGANTTAKLERMSSTGNGIMACMLPAGLLVMFFGRKRFKRPLGLLVMLLLLGSVATLSGCGNSFSMTQTPVGSYTFQVVGSGNNTGATQAGTVKLTVTQ